jgi:prepilin-type N-terminal cleavage/methylation domain-containing protein
MKNNKVFLKTGRRVSGFSLVELLVVISIISVLTSVLMANFMGARERARDSQRIQDMNAAKNALRMYYNDHQSYPIQLTSQGVSTYLQGMNSLVNVGVTYEQTDGGDGFNMCSVMESANANDDIDSQIKCGMGTTTATGSPVTVCGIGETKDNFFAVCAR